ncbi:MAG: hypothetical protein II805_04555 [Candidatus Methanomethylophilus sp.]|nr:hypothetical protein [Methanomethylophilus sp.]
MNRNTLAAIGIVAIVAIAAGIGAAYAYQSTLGVNGNNVAAEAVSIDVYQNSEGHPHIDGPFTIPAYEKNGNKEITGYCISTTGPGTVTLWCNMSNSASWVFIDSMSIDINGSSYAFGKTGAEPNIQTGVPATFTVSGESGAFYDFTIHIDYADIEPSDAYDALLTSFHESEFAFYFSPAA